MISISLPNIRPLRRNPKPIMEAMPCDVELVRSESGSHGTFGRMHIHGEPGPFTCEPPWADNQPNISCIPTGTYRCVWHRSPKYGWVYLVTGVLGRGHILIHPGNFGGNRALGLKTHTHGCILPGRRRGVIGAQQAVLVSRPATREFYETMGEKPFIMRVTGEFE